MGRDQETEKSFLVFGSDRSESDARTKGMEMLSGQNIDWEVRMIPTRDIASASRATKGYKLSQSHDFRGSIQRLKHKRRGQPARAKGSWGSWGR